MMIVIMMMMMMMIIDNDDHNIQVCGRKFVRRGRIVGGNVASYAEWPWQVSCH